MEEFYSNDQINDATYPATENGNSNNHGWQKVTYTKRKKNQKKDNNAASKANGIATIPGGEAGSNVFRAIEEHSEDRKRRILEAQREAAAAATAADLASKKTRSKQRRWGDDSDEDYDGEDDGRRENGVVDEENKKKEKKAKKKDKKPKVTVSEAAGKIDPNDLAAFLVDISGSYGSQEDIQLMRFADYFGRAFSSVSAAQFPWVKTFRESNVAKIVEIPLSNIPEAVYKTAADWINQRSIDALNSFSLWLLDSILTDLAAQIANVKGSKKGSQQSSSKSQVAVFVVLAMVLRRKPDVLVNILSTLRENTKYQGQDKIPVIVWMTSQVSQVDPAVGVFAWAHNLVPILNSKSGNNPLLRDLILQLVERILSAPKARTVLVNNAVRKGERLVPPTALETLVQVTFPAPSARIKATERFEAVYPTLKEVALAGVPGSKAMKQVSQQIFSIAIKMAGEGTPELRKEAAGICIWCFGQSNDSYKQWDKVYLDNLDASVVVLRKLSEQWKELRLSQPSLDAMKATLNSFQQKNERALAEDSDNEALLKDADKYCKVLLGRLSRGHGCLKAMAVVVVAMGVGAAVMSQNPESFDLNRLSVMLSSSFKSF